jgi:hypothetical protein
MPFYAFIFFIFSTLPLFSQNYATIIDPDEGIKEETHQVLYQYLLELPTHTSFDEYNKAAEVKANQIFEAIILDRFPDPIYRPENAMKVFLAQSRSLCEIQESYETMKEVSRFMSEFGLEHKCSFKGFFYGTEAEVRERRLKSIAFSSFSSINCSGKHVHFGALQAIGYCIMTGKPRTLVYQIFFKDRKEDYYDFLRTYGVLSPETLDVLD